MANKKNLKPQDVDEEIEKSLSPRDLNPMPRYWRKRNPGEERAKKETEERKQPEYPGSKE